MSGIRIPYGSGLVSHAAPFGGAYIAGGASAFPRGHPCHMTRECISLRKQSRVRGTDAHNNWVRFLQAKLDQFHALGHMNVTYRDLMMDPGVKAEYQAWVGHPIVKKAKKAKARRAPIVTAQGFAGPFLPYVAPAKRPYHKKKAGGVRYF